MPSRFEPCGLGQMIAMRYGSVPVVRATGGLVDTVREGVSGFLFADYTVEAFWGALSRALATYRTDPAAWQAPAARRHGGGFLVDHVRARLPAGLRLGVGARARLVTFTGDQEIQEL